MKYWMCVQVWQAILAVIGSASGGIGLFLLICGTNKKSRMFGFLVTLVSALVVFIAFSVVFVAGGG